MHKFSLEEELLLKSLEEISHAYASATELRIAKDLIKEDYIKVWDTIGGFPAWRLTEKGRNR